MANTDRVTDPRFREHGVGSPLIFLILFIFFVYGSLIVGLLGLSRWLIESYHLKFFHNLGDAGLILMIFCLLGVWFSLVLAAAGIPYFWLRHLGRYRLADKVALIITLFLFHIFSAPFILWRMIRNSSPRLRRRYRQKLRHMVKGSRKIQERRFERQRQSQCRK